MLNKFVIVIFILISYLFLKFLNNIIPKFLKYIHNPNGKSFWLPYLSSSSCYKLNNEDNLDCSKIINDINSICCKNNQCNKGIPNINVCKNKNSDCYKKIDEYKNKCQQSLKKHNSPQIKIFLNHVFQLNFVILKEKIILV